MADGSVHCIAINRNYYISPPPKHNLRHTNLHHITALHSTPHHHLAFRAIRNTSTPYGTLHNANSQHNTLLYSINFMRRISRSLPITIPWELSEFSFCGELYDVVISVTLRFEPGDPGCYRTPNGDGWPPTGPTVDLEQVRIVRADPPVDHEEFERTVRAFVYEAEECDTPEWHNIVEAASRQAEERDDYDG